MLRFESEELVAAARKEGEEFMRMAQDSQQRVELLRKAAKASRQQFKKDQATIQELMKKNAEQACTVKEMQGALNVRAKELEVEVQALKGKQNELVVELSHLRDVAKQAGIDARLAWDEFNKVDSVMYSNFSFCIHRP